MAVTPFDFRGRLDRLRHYRHIVAVLMKYGLEEVAGGLRTNLKLPFRGTPPPKDAARGHSRPERLRMALEELGPTFVKFGQLLSTRPDVVPPEYARELERLQDHVKPILFTRIEAQIEKQFGRPLADVFLDFEAEPLAAGSIAQVHRATTREGIPVAVKVRRPGIRQIVMAEREILEDLAGILRVTLFGHSTLDPKQMVREVGEAILHETDLLRERRNQLRCQQDFAEDETIHIPCVYNDYCTEGILTMEFVDGIKPLAPSALLQRSLDPKVLAQRGVEFVLRQIFEVGFFHADPHPGNFIILPENILAPIDYGQVARLSMLDRRLFNEMMVSIVDRDAQRIVDTLEHEDMLDERTDCSRLSAEIEQLIGTYHELPLRDIPFGQVVTQIFDLFRLHYVRPPAQFTLMLKSLVTIEGFAKSLDPDFNMVEALKPHARRWHLRDLDPKQLMRHLVRALQDAGELAWHLPDDINTIINKFRQGRFLVRVQHEHLEHLVKTLDKSSNRISFALIIAALLVASSHLVSQEGTVLGLFDLQTMGVAGYVIASLIGIWLIISILRGGRL